MVTFNKSHIGEKNYRFYFIVNKVRHAKENKNASVILPFIYQSSIHLFISKRKLLSSIYVHLSVFKIFFLNVWIKRIRMPA